MGITGRDQKIPAMKTVTHRSVARPRPMWQELSRRFPDDLDCLACYLALEAAEVLEGVKPANLVNVVNKPRSCGRNIYVLWKNQGSALLQHSGLEAIEFIDRGNSVLLFLYRRSELTALLARKSVAIILRKAGYTDPANLEKTLVHLQGRFSKGNFPHEIGVFLGYPLKDVIGFMGWAQLPFSSQGPWKIYGDPRESLSLADIHRQCRSHKAHQLNYCDNPLNCLKIAVPQTAVSNGAF
jgi:hypothetical protein